MVQAVLAPVLDEDKRLKAIAEAMDKLSPPVVRGKMSAEAGVGTDFEEEAAALDQDPEIAKIQERVDAKQ